MVLSIQPDLEVEGLEDLGSLSDDRQVATRPHRSGDPRIDLWIRAAEDPYPDRLALVAWLARAVPGPGVPQLQ